MSKIKGQNFRLFVAGSAVPEETNCTVTLTGNTEDTSTKDSEGLFGAESVVSKSWSVTVDSYDASDENLTDLASTFVAAAAVTVGWDQTTGAAGTQNRTASSANFKRSGNALLNDVTFQFNDRAICTVSLQFQGTGALS